MSIAIKINGYAQAHNYIGWTPVACSVEVAAPQGAGNVVIKSVQTSGGGDVVFSHTHTAHGSATLAMALPAVGAQAAFYIAGSVASTEDQDVMVEVTDAANGTVLAKTTLMVRVRKNANTLTQNEINRFLNALVKFNNSIGTPNYKNFLNMHNEDANTEIHSTNKPPRPPRYSFLVWHRGYVLDLERQLQKIDASVTIPYWKFDEPAPHIFTKDFMGASEGSNTPAGTGTLIFSNTNPMQSWISYGEQTIFRNPSFDVQTSRAVSKLAGFGPNIATDAQTLAYGNTFKKFRVLEGTPHGYAHESFYSGQLTDIYTAPEDPLFFLLHSNIDRLWATWQMVNQRYNIASTDTYPLLGAYTNGDPSNIGDYIDDTMWPWNDNTSTTRPPTAPGGPFPQIAVPATPSADPLVWEHIDYQGYNGGAPSYADYDLIKFTV